MESIVTGRMLSLEVSNDLFMYKTNRLTIGTKPSRTSPTQGEIDDGNGWARRYSKRKLNYDLLCFP